MRILCKGAARAYAVLIKGRRRRPAYERVASHRRRRFPRNSSRRRNFPRSISHGHEENVSIGWQSSRPRQPKSWGARQECGIFFLNEARAKLSARLRPRAVARTFGPRYRYISTGCRFGYARKDLPASRLSGLRARQPLTAELIRTLFNAAIEGQRAPAPPSARPYSAPEAKNYRPTSPFVIGFYLHLQLDTRGAERVKSRAPSTASTRQLFFFFPPLFFFYYNLCVSRIES
jgi:hypothetical protein